MRLSRRSRSLALAASMLLAPVGASAQAWNYQSYPDGEDPSKSLDVPLYPGYITLDETGSAPVFHMYVGKTTKCFSGDIEAKVSRTPEATTIVVKRDLKGCGSARFVIRNDGSGGQRQIIRDGSWTWDGLERGLTPRK
jgi:hypothetical protein